MTRKVWYMSKIEDLESRLAAALAAKMPDVRATGTDNLSYAEGVYQAMTTFGCMTKMQRQKIRQQIIEHGPGIMKRMKGGKKAVPLVQVAY